MLTQRQHLSMPTMQLRWQWLLLPRRLHWLHSCTLPSMVTSRENALLSSSSLSFSPRELNRKMDSCGTHAHHLSSIFCQCLATEAAYGDTSNQTLHQRTHVLWLQ